ncbi:MAG TPA: peptidylprolyl isomerase [Candidatus Limnocylindrales bacterium]|nr:peptidylprolyl isomerase [Candidatus Limnocylindrales bacterium]
MTFRARPVAQRPPKPSWESRDRRNFLLNLGFGLAVLAALLILVIAVGWYYYNDHLVSVGKVDGQSISKDELRDRVLIEQGRLTEARNRISTQVVAGHLTQSQAELQEQYIQQQENQLAAISLERIIDNRIQAKLANEEGVTVGDADIDARLTEEATVKESRHAWQIEVKPEAKAGAVPTAEQIAAARTKIQAALTDINGGKSWDDIARTVSTDSATAPQAGDLGWITNDDTQSDEAFLTALFAAEEGSPTEVVEGEDGIFRIGRVTEIAPESVDGVYQEKIVNEGLDLANYRAVVRGDVIRRKLEDKLVADASKPAPQRETSEIYLSKATIDLPDEAVKVRHILYSPNDNPTGASDGTIPADDPAWGQAKLDAEAAYAKLKADISQFDSVAREESDEGSALGPDGSGGVLQDYVAPGNTTYSPSFTQPILDAKPTDGQLLPPFKTEFGWHVVQVISHAPDLAKIKTRVDSGADFATIARDVSEGAEAARGGELGWVAKGQLDKKLIDAIFATPIGKTSAIVTVENDGQYLFRVTKEEERTAEGRQLDEIRSRLFFDWYQPKKDAVAIERDERLTAPSG